MSSKSAGSSNIGCNNNENKTICTSNIQRPILSCLNETEDQQQQSRLPYPNYQQRQHKQPQNCTYNQMLQPENQHQQHQVNNYTWLLELIQDYIMLHIIR